jgi:hypothetical protein
MILARLLRLGFFHAALASVALGQVVVLDSFNAGATTGSVRAGTSWVNNVSTSASTVTVGGSAQDDNGWGATGQSINASSLGFLSVTAKRDAGHAASSFVIQFEDRNLNTQVFSVSATAFAIGSLTAVQVPLNTWSSTFDRSQIVSWSIGGGGLGTTPFRMTFDHLALSSTADPATPTAPTVTGSFGSVSRALGDSVTFTVNAAGTAPFTYQWFKDNTALPTATAASLTLGNVVATDSGSYTVRVTNAAGNVTSGAFVLTVNATPATITLGDLAQVYTGTPRSVSATTSPAGLPLTINYAGSTTPPTAAGTYALVATTNHPTFSGRAEGTLVVARAPQSISFAALPATLTVGTPVTLSATSSSGGAVAFALVSGGADLVGSVLTPRAVSTLTVRVTQAGDTNYLPASADFSFNTAKQNQSLTFAAFTAPLGSDTVTLSGAASSNLPVQFSVITGPAQIAGNTLSLTGSGLVIVRASQPGDDTFNAAPHVDRSFIAVGPAAAPSAPVIARSPASQSVTAGAPLTLAVDATGSATLAYQWFKNEAPVAGGTSSTFVIARSAASDAGIYHVTVSNALGSARSANATITVEAAAEATTRLANFSTRARAGTDEQVVIAGFAIAGTAPKQVLVRAVGPSLGQFGVTGLLAAPALEVFRAQGSTSTSVARNTGWSTAANAAALAAAARQSGAFELATGTADSALLLTLEPGSYTAVIGSADNRPGVGLIEVYDLSSPVRGQQIANLSIRATAGTDADTLIVGIVVQGTARQRLLVRAIGPGLGQFGVSGFLARPQLALFAGTAELARNVGWSSAGNAATVAQVATQVGAFPLTAGSADSALLIELTPGNYTAQVSGVGATSGVALVEVYEAP